MRLFLDASVLLAACASAGGASREICRTASAHDWELLATPYVVAEVLKNLPDFPLAASAEWVGIRRGLLVLGDVLTLDRPALFSVSKDKPILFGALAWADVLLTLDRSDFGALMGGSFYGMPVLRPGQWVERQRAAGRWRSA